MPIWYVSLVVSISFFRDMAKRYHGIETFANALTANRKAMYCSYSNQIKQIERSFFISPYKMV